SALRIGGARVRLENRGRRSDQRLGGDRKRRSAGGAEGELDSLLPPRPPAARPDARPVRPGGGPGPPPQTSAQSVRPRSAVVSETTRIAASRGPRGPGSTSA